MTRSMICRLAFLLLLALPFVTKGQADLRNTSLTEPGRNLLYRGVSNVIEVTGITYTSAMRLISSRNMLPEHMSRYEDKFYLMEHASDGADTLSLYQGNQLLVRKVFNTATIPDPVLQLGIVKDSFARVPDILAYPSLRVVFPGCYYKTRIRIISFDIRVIPARGTSTDLGTTTGPDLSAQQQSYIRSLQPGSTIILENTKFIAAGGCPRSLSPITIRVR